MCSGLKSGVHFGRSGQTIGSILLTDKKLADLTPDFLNHEAEHMRQYHYYQSLTDFWPVYFVYYLDQPSNPCDNIYEK